MKKLPFHFKIVAQADNSAPAQIHIRGVIGDYIDDFWNLTNTEEAVLNELNQIPVGKKIEMYVNTPGGRVDYTLGIYNALKSRYADVTTINAGFACSSGSLLMLAGARRICPDSSVVMIHRPSGGGEGNEDDLSNILSGLQACQRMMVDIYSKEMGLTAEKVLEMMKKETWMTGKEAVAMGFATDSGDDDLQTDDGADGDGAMTDSNALKIIAGFKNIPANLRSRFTAKAPAGSQPPTNKHQPTPAKSMKKITAALVAAGLITATTEELTEDSLLPQINAVIAENKRLKTDNENHIAARKLRVANLVDAAIADKVVAESRKARLIALGETNEEEVTAQISELRAARAETSRPGRGARPAPAGGNTEAPTLEEVRAEMADPATSPERKSELAIQARALRGHKELFAAAKN